MKNILVTYFIFQTLTVYSQTDSTEKFLNDILLTQKMEYEGEIRISPVSSSWIKAHLKNLTESEDTDTISSFFSTMDTLHLTGNEKNLIIAHFSDPSNLRVPGEPWSLDTIRQRSAVRFLKNNEDGQVLFLSKPLFIRDGTIAISFFSSLCCGGENGSINISAYRKENDTWTRWIDLSTSEF